MSPKSAGKKTRKRRSPLSREAIVAAAIELCDEKGFNALTMRALASRVRVEPMSLYHHVANKEELLDGVIDAIFAEMEIPLPGDDWKDALRRRTHSARSVLASHPWSVPLLDSRTTPGVGPEMFAHHNAVVGSLFDAGFSPSLVGQAYIVLDSYIYGFVIQEDSFTGELTEENPDLAEDMHAALAEEYPNIGRMLQNHLEGPGFEFDKMFEFGLEIIISGLERELAKES